MNALSAKKLLNSKWTRVNPERKEKHFLVSKVKYDEDGIVLECEIEAVLTRSTYAIDWRVLRDSKQWMTGWK